MDLLINNKDFILQMCLLWNAGEILRLAVKSGRALKVSITRKNGFQMEIKEPPKTPPNEPHPNEPQPESDDRPAG